MGDESIAGRDQTLFMSQLAHAPPGYEHVRPLGATGYGDAYLATERGQRRDVVVLEIPRSLFSGPAAVERLRIEAGVLAATTVGPLIRILEIDARGDPVWVVTEHVAGTSLRDLLDAGPLPAARALPILEDVAGALRLMALHGLAHGSVTPDHVVVQPHGRARLGGFAVVQALSPTEADEWSDAYDFAVLAQQTLTGTPPTLSPDDPLPLLPWRAAEALLAGLADPPRERPLPHELVEVLRDIPVEDWTGAPAPDHVVPAPLEETESTAPPAAEPEPEVEPDVDERFWTPPRWFRWICITLGLIVTVGAAAAGAYLLEPWQMTPDELEVRSVSVEGNPGPVVRCPNAEVRYLATLTTNGRPGELTVSWIRPDGSQPQPETIEVREGQKSVQTEVRFTFRGREPWVGRAVVLVDGDDSGSGNGTISYRCARG
jgi:serine/threonine-protein kinase